MMSLQDLNYTASDLTSEIKEQLAEMPRLKALLDEAQARFQASPYADAVECSECGGAGRHMVSYNVGYDEWDSDEELCEYCLLEGVYPWDIKTEWFDEEATKASLDPDLDEDELEDELQDLLRDQASDLEVEAPQVIKDYKKASYAFVFIPHEIHQKLSLLKRHCETSGVDTSWVDEALEEVESLIG